MFRRHKLAIGFDCPLTVQASTFTIIRIAWNIQSSAHSRQSKVRPQAASKNFGFTRRAAGREPQVESPAVFQLLLFPNDHWKSYSVPSDALSWGLW